MCAFIEKRNANVPTQFWDSITKEDLEFSVGTKMNNWEVKELLPEEDRRATTYQDDHYSHSNVYDSSYAPSQNANRYSRY